MAAKERTDDVFPLAAFSRFLPKTRVWGSRPENEGFIGGSGLLTSTLSWGCGYTYDETASGSLDQRMYASSYGRFNTPDRVPSSANPSDPGSFNRFSFVAGDPTNRVDPRGTDDGTAEFCIENPDACWDPCQPPVAQAHAFFVDPEPDPSCYPVPGGGGGGGGGGGDDG